MIGLSGWQTWWNEAQAYWQSSSIYSLFEIQINTDLNDLKTKYEDYITSLSTLNSTFVSILPTLMSYVLIKYNIYSINTSNLNLETLIGNPPDLRTFISYYSATLPSYTDLFSEINSTSLNDSIILDLITAVNGYGATDTTQITGLKTNIQNLLSSSNVGLILSNTQTGSLQVNFKYFLLNYCYGQQICSDLNWTIPGIYS